MATIGTLIERLFQNTYAAVSLPPPGTPTRAFSLVLPFSPSRPLSLAPSRYRSSSLSSRTFSLFQPPFSSRSLIRVRPMPYPLGLLSRSSLLPSPFPFVSARPPLLSRVVVPLSKPLFPPRYITTLPRLVRSSSNSLCPLAASPPRASSHSSRSRPPSLPTLRPCLYSFRNCSLFFSPFLSPISPPFSLALFFALPAVFFLRPTLFRSTFMYRLVSGMRDVHHTSARVRTCAPRPSFSRSSRAAGRRACSNRFDTRSWGKKNGRMYRRRLSPRRVNTPRPRVRARATRALGQWRNFSRFFLLPFCIGPAFRIYLRVIRFAAGYNMRLASRRMDAAGVR